MLESHCFYNICKKYFEIGFGGKVKESSVKVGCFTRPGQAAWVEDSIDIIPWVYFYFE